MSSHKEVWAAGLEDYVEPQDPNDAVFWEEKEGSISPYR